MAHEVYKLNGKDSMAYVGNEPWHGLGQKLTQGASIETWVEEAQMRWLIEEANVLYLDDKRTAHAFQGQKVLYRSDNKEPLSIVTHAFNVVQPREVIEFFRDLVEAGNMTLETAGTLRGGRIQWALARIDRDMELIDNTTGEALSDLVQMYALLATACDRSMSSTGRLTGTRVVCKNTMDMAYRSGVNIAKYSHRGVFDKKAQDNLKEQMGLAHKEMDEREQEMKAMATASLKKEDAVGFFLSVLGKENKDGTLDISGVTPKSVETLYNAYKKSPGSNLPSAKDTLWGAVNAVTYQVDHNPNAQSDETRLDSAWFGGGRQQKAKAYTVAQEIVLEERDSNLLDSLLEKPMFGDQADRILKAVGAG